MLTGPWIFPANQPGFKSASLAISLTDGVFAQVGKMQVRIY